MRAFVLLCLLDAAFAGMLFNWNGLGRDTLVADPDAESVCRIDQRTCSCCLMLQEVNRMRTYVNASLNKLEQDYLKTINSFRTVQASRTAFSAALHNYNLLKCFGPFDEDRPLVYRHVFLNMGGAYDTATGIFTVPHSGVYSLALTVYSDAGAPGSKLAACAGLQVNGRVIAGSKDRGANDPEDSDNVIVATHLQTGDQVVVSLPKGCFLCDDSNHYNTFSAFLLYVTE